ncbi:MAG: hypothetical protein QNJ34_26550 [Xenococcaceae cyanobacterium MO_188.B29]|nr:hypothetical protein [Xenococcaceae cyanobacterium MO_188.B29]
MTQEKQESSYKIAEFSSLRDEILRSDRTCSLITGYLIPVTAALWYNQQVWLTSFFSFIALCYFTEKRFIIRTIATYIEKDLNNVSQWESKVTQLRNSNPGLRPTNLLRPYNSEIAICLSIALLSLFAGNMATQLLHDRTGYTIIWFIFFLLIVYLSIVNAIQYNFMNFFKFKEDEEKKQPTSIIILKLIGAFLTALAGFVLTKNWWISIIVIILFVGYIFAEDQLLPNKNTQ